MDEFDYLNLQLAHLNGTIDLENSSLDNIPKIVQSPFKVDNENAAPSDLTPMAEALYIKVENGAVVDHPVLIENLQQVYGEIPANYEPFMRFMESQRIPLGIFEVRDRTVPLYTKVNGIWTDVFAKRPMNAQERYDKEQELLAVFNNNIQGIKQFLTDRKNEATLPEDIAIWEQELAEYDGWVFNGDYENPNIRLPLGLIRRDENGNVVTTNNQGSAPDVIG